METECTPNTSEAKITLQPTRPHCDDGKSLYSTPKYYLNLLHLNIQCIRNKILELEVLLKTSNYQIICLNEHWLSSDEITSLRIDGYQVVSFFCRSVRKHGGVSVLASEKLKCSPILNLVECSVEVHCEILGIKVQNVQIITVYRSALGDFNIFLDKIILLLDKLDITKNIVVTGDFNVHFNTADQRALQLCNLFGSFGLKQRVTVNTRNDSCLDNMITNLNESSMHASTCDLNLSDHLGICFSFEHTIKKPASSKRINYRPITNYGLTQLYNYIDNDCWSFLDDPSIDIDTKFENFINY